MLQIVSVVFGCIGFIGFVMTVIGADGAVANRKPGVPRQQPLGYSPYFLLFWPEDLSPRGLRFRRLYFRGLLVMALGAVPLVFLAIHSGKFPRPATIQPNYVLPHVQRD